MGIIILMTLGLPYAFMCIVRKAQGTFHWSILSFFVMTSCSAGGAMLGFLFADVVGYAVPQSVEVVTVGTYALSPIDRDTRGKPIYFTVSEANGETHVYMKPRLTVKQYEEYIKAGIAEIPISNFSTEKKSSVQKATVTYSCGAATFHALFWYAVAIHESVSACDIEVTMPENEEVTYEA